MQLKFLNSVAQILPKKGSLILIGPGRAFQGGLHEKLLPESISSLFKEALKSQKQASSPVSLTTLTGLAAPHKVVLSLLPEKVSKDNSPTRREWIYQQLDAVDGDEYTTVVLCLDKPDHLAAALTAVARRLRLVNYRAQAKQRHIHVLALNLQGEVLPIDAGLKTLSEEVSRSCRLADMTPQELNPSSFAKEITAQFRGRPQVTIKEILGPKLLSEGLHGIHAVGRAAVDEPRMIILDYKPRAARKTVVLAGKGVCYDTGGLSLKVGGSMVGMKGDMGGAAAILASFSYLTQNAYPHRLIACVGLVENAIGPKAFRNDEVITMHSGKTVEVNNTDAEGRLVLADCLSYCARKYSPQLLIDAATLTGAQMVATGYLHAGVISNREDLENLARKIGKETGDLVAPLPFAPELYQNEFRSQVADMVNSVKNRSNAQTSCAAQFIYSHIDDLDIPWLHIDMAGPANTPAGLGTGYGIQLIARLAREYL